MNINVILTGNLPLERGNGKDSRRDRVRERERDQMRVREKAREGGRGED